ncbi:hypothetical protein MB27_30350 [Actinoplanes utahensis]|uniref:HTH tetR-type domain-containing protein n=1 Tax=Actinoplanes utahensis TaxID=1869 RepID=A0A0A6UDT4_ACTUT|nr:hypothetical protein MB27_30350 [Actinoplanes utahensis]
MLDAIRELLTEVGYDRMSIDEVARRAKASKATIYRRWSGKPDMVAAALHGMITELPDPPDTGSLRTDMIATLTTLCRVYERKHPIVLSVLSAIRTDPTIGRLMHDHILDSGTAGADIVFARAVTRGELPALPDVPAVVEVGKALLWHRLLLSGRPLDDPWVVHVVDDILHPMLGLPG